MLSLGSPLDPHANILFTTAAVVKSAVVLSAAVITKSLTLDILVSISGGFVL